MVIRIALPFAIFLLGFGAWVWLSQPVEEPKPKKGARKILRTERLILQRADYQIHLNSQGTVRAHHATALTALVTGRVIHIYPTFEDGAFFKEGEILAELDPSDLQAQVTGAESRLARAEANLAREEARAKQAKLNWEDIGYEEEPSPLVLREPQLKEARAVVNASHAELDQARRNLERAKIRAPFDGRVKKRRIGLGQAVNATTQLGDVFATDIAEVRLPLSPSQLRFINLPTHGSDAPLSVTLTDALGRDAPDGPSTWHAKIIRTEGTLDETSRELFAIARIEDPFGLIADTPELRIGQPVRAKIKAMIIPNVFVIPRDSLRGVNLIYRVNPQQSRIIKTKIEPIWSNEEVILVRDGIGNGDWLATSRMPHVSDGAPVEIVKPSMADTINEGGLKKPEHNQSWLRQNPPLASRRSALISGLFSPPVIFS